MKDTDFERQNETSEVNKFARLIEALQILNKYLQLNDYRFEGRKMVIPLEDGVSFAAFGGVPSKRELQIMEEVGFNIHYSQRIITLHDTFEN